MNFLLILPPRLFFSTDQIVFTQSGVCSPGPSAQMKRGLKLIGVFVGLTGSIISLVMATLSAGMRLGPYEVISAIGAGGMGEVYRARDTRIGREVAVKILPAQF